MNIAKRFLAVLGLLIASTLNMTAQQFGVIYSFPLDGAPCCPKPPAILAQGPDGSLYSTLPFGGNTSGAVFKVTPKGKFTDLYDFEADKLFAPYGGLTLGTDGRFYGTTSGGGNSLQGTVFAITMGGQLTTLYTFSGGSDGFAPYAPPIEGVDKNFYGTTLEAGSQSPQGTMYKVTTSGSLTTIHQFQGTDGAGPAVPLIQGIDGNLYGSTQFGGSRGDGALFRVTTAGSLTLLHSFDFTTGAYPSALIQASDGNFYGTTLSGGADNKGVVFRMTASGDVTVLHSFNPSGGDGGAPQTGLVQASDGNLYGTAQSGGASGYGTIFRVGLDGTYATVYSFDGTTAAYPVDTLLQHTNGKLYGMSMAAVENAGTVYSLNLGLKPFVALVLAAGKIGSPVAILGQGLTGAKSVSFNGVPIVVP